MKQIGLLFSVLALIGCKTADLVTPIYLDEEKPYKVEYSKFCKYSYYKVRGFAFIHEERLLTH